MGAILFNSVPGMLDWKFHFIVCVCKNVWKLLFVCLSNSAYFSWKDGWLKIARLIKGMRSVQRFNFVVNILSHTDQCNIINTKFWCAYLFTIPSILSHRSRNMSDLQVISNRPELRFSLEDGLIFFIEFSSIKMLRIRIYKIRTIRGLSFVVLFACFGFSFIERVLISKY